jgi:hypothetical protein
LAAVYLTDTKKPWLNAAKAAVLSHGLSYIRWTTQPTNHVTNHYPTCHAAHEASGKIRQHDRVRGAKVEQLPPQEEMKLSRPIRTSVSTHVLGGIKLN